MCIIGALKPVLSSSPSVLDSYFILDVEAHANSHGKLGRSDETHEMIVIPLWQQKEEAMGTLNVYTNVYVYLNRPQ